MDKNRTAAVTTTRSTFKIEDPSWDPERVDPTATDEGFCREEAPDPKIQRGPSPPTKRKPYLWAAAARAKAYFRALVLVFMIWGEPAKTQNLGA